MSLCIHVMVMSSVYAVSFTGACSVGVENVYMLNNVGDKHHLLEHQFCACIVC